MSLVEGVARDEDAINRESISGLVYLDTFRGQIAGAAGAAATCAALPMYRVYTSRAYAVRSRLSRNILNTIIELKTPSLCKYQIIR